MPHIFESSQILREKEECVIFQSNNVGSPITFFVSFSCFLSVQFDNSMNVVNYKVLGIKIIRNSFIRASLLIHTLLCRLLFFSCASAALPIPDNLIF